MLQAFIACAGAPKLITLVIEADLNSVIRSFAEIPTAAKTYLISLEQYSGVAVRPFATFHQTILPLSLLDS
jgi:hypothetical protein